MWGALVLARRAGFYVIPVESAGLVRADEDVLRVGSDASASEVATIACRRILAKVGVHDEARVLLEVERRGYDYVPYPQRMAAVS